MSNCSVLHTSNSDDPLDSEDTYPDESAAEGSAQRDRSDSIEVCGARIPLLWMAMFSTGDARARDIDYSSEELDDEEQYLVFVTTLAKAIENLARRSSSLQALIPEQYSNHIDNFIAVLTRSTRRYVHVAIDDVEQISSDSMVESAKAWESVLADLDNNIPQVRSGPTRYLLGDGVPGCWKVLLSWAGLATGRFSPKSTQPTDQQQYLISGADTADEILQWEL